MASLHDDRDCCCVAATRVMAVVNTGEHHAARRSSLAPRRTPCRCCDAVPVLGTGRAVRLVALKSDSLASRLARSKRLVIAE